MEKTKKILWENRLFLISMVILLFLNFCFDFYYIKSGSMEPILPVGTIAIVDTNAEGEVQMGDIFAYRNGRNIVIHRVIAVEEAGYRFKGDANPSEDAVIVTEEQLVGKVIAKATLLVPWVRLFSKALK